MKTIYSSPTLSTRFLLLGVLPLLYIATGCMSKAETESTVRSKPVIVGVPVDGKIIKSGTLREDLELVGTLVANQQVDLVSELTRRITKVLVKEGSQVRAGALLFQLDDADLQAQLERLKQQEKLAELNEHRLADLIKHDAVMQQDHDEAFTNLKVLQAQIQELQVTISKTKIVAPFSGQIGIINVHQGAVVSVNTVLANIQDNSVIKVEFRVPEKYASAIELGSKQHFSLSSDTKTYTAHVTAKEASLDENTRTLLIRAATPNPQGKLWPGQSARLSLSLNASSNALTVSSQALIPSSLGYSVYALRQNRAQLQPVQIGQRTAGSVEITKGLQNGDTIITSNLLRLSPNSQVHFVTLN